MQPHAIGKPRRALKTGMIKRGMLASALIILLRVIMIALVVLSVFGTFYAMRGQDAPLTSIWLMFVHAADDGGTFLNALILQALLSVAQWGSSELAQEDTRWWWMYAGALLPSIWMNIEAYATPVMALMGWQGPFVILAWGIIVAADVAPELFLKQ